MYLQQNDRVWLSGDSAELWLNGYNVRVNSGATVENTPPPRAKKVLVTIDQVDHDSNVTASVRISKLRKLNTAKL